MKRKTEQKVLLVQANGQGLDSLNTHLQQGWKIVSQSVMPGESGENTLFTLEKVQPDVEYTRPRPAGKFLNAARRGDFALVQEEIGLGVNVDAQDEHGWTALLWSVSKGYEKVAIYLLECGADPNVKNRGGSYPLGLAAEQNLTKVMDELIRHGADPNLGSKFCGTPLFGAAEEGHFDATKLLVDKGAAVNVQNPAGWSALMMAAQEGHFEVVRLLIEAGANPKQRDKLGRDAEKIARLAGHSEIVKWLEQFNDQ